MPHPDTTFHGLRVSWAWGVVLTYLADEKKIRFKINSARRTKADQLEMIRKHGIYNASSNPHGAAPYSPNAPHVSEGRQNHALDIDSSGDGENRVQRALHSMGVEAINNVVTEAWHLYVPNEHDLIALAERLQSKMFPRLYKGVINRSATTELQKLLRMKGYKSVRVNGKYDLATRLAVRRYQRKKGLTTTSKSHVTEKTWRSLRG